MSEHQKNKRQPAAFKIDDSRVKIDEVGDQSEFDGLPDFNEDDLGERTTAGYSSKRSYKNMGWLALFLSAVGGLIFLSFSLWLSGFISSLFLRQDWIGWTALLLLALAVCAALMICLNEIWALTRLKHLNLIKLDAEKAIDEKDISRSRKVAQKTKDIFRSRQDLRWGFAKLKDHEKDILDADDLLILVERELIIPLDEKAKDIIADSARRVSVITTLSPFALVDMSVVAYENLRLLRRLSILYGGRPGTFGLFRLGGMVITHLTLTGGIALSSDFIQQFLGHKLAAKVSAKLGEGLFNGAMTTRIGLATIDVCRPLPFLKASKPTFSTLVKNLMANTLYRNSKKDIG